MVKTYLKTMRRMFRRHLTRLVSVALMVLVSIGFAAGIGMATDKLNYALDDVYHTRNVSDLIVKSVRPSGFTEDEIAKLQERYQTNVVFGTSLEFENRAISSAQTVELPLVGSVEVQTDTAFEGMGDGVVKAYFFEGEPETRTQNLFHIIDERREETEDIPVYAERSTYQLPEYALGTRFHATVTTTYRTAAGERAQTSEYTFYVAGILENPLHLAVRDDVSLQFEDGDDPAELESIFYLFDSELSPAPNGNDAYITFSDRSRFVMSGAYKTYAEAEAESVKTLLEEAETLTLSENFTFSSFHEYGVKVEGIGYVIMVVFLLVTLLVVLSTMTRLLDEERAQIACLTTLGYAPLMILSKYLLFALTATVIGGVGAYFAAMGLAYVVYINFNWNYSLPPYPAEISVVFFLIVSAAILLATLAATLIAGLHMTKKAPAELLRPKSPKPGKKVILEHIPLLWNRLSFKYKSTLRNVLRFKTRFTMTVVAVMASTALVLAGLAVLDCCLFQDVGTAAMIGVAVIVLLFAAMLNAVVIYTLTNINISERERELATLMVLGYYDGEVTGYIFREVYITSAIGIAFGLPFGCLLCLFIFRVMGFGSIPGIGWYAWIAAPLLSLFFTFLVTIMLRRKITRIRMNESLKAIE